MQRIPEVVLTFFDMKDVKDALKNNDMRRFYGILDDIKSAHPIVGEVTELLIEAGVDPLSGMSKIPDDFLINQAAVNEFDIPEEITEIGRCAFSYCSNLMHCNIPANVTKIGTEAFRNCYSLARVDVNAKVLHIAPYVFAHCDQLTDISLPATLYQINKGAFYGCTSLKHIYFASTVFAWCNVVIDPDNFPVHRCTIFCKDGTLEYNKAHKCWQLL